MGVPEPHVVVATDGAEAVAAAVAHGGRTAIWIGEPHDLELAEFVAEIGPRDQNPS